MAITLVPVRLKRQIRGMRKRKQPHPSLSIPDSLAEDVRLCAWPTCRMTAEHRAPASRENLREYRWFCLDHVREYNKRWNYFDGMSDEEVEADLRHDIVWNRPSWPIGDRDLPPGKSPRKGPKPGIGPFGIDPAYFHDDFELFDKPLGRDGGAGVVRPDPTIRDALAIFGLDLPIASDTLKSRYKELVKKHHPDANGGTKASEEKFKEIRRAYEALKQFLVA